MGLGGATPSQLLPPPSPGVPALGAEVQNAVASLTDTNVL